MKRLLAVLAILIGLSGLATISPPPAGADHNGYDSPEVWPTYYQWDGDCYFSNYRILGHPGDGGTIYTPPQTYWSVTSVVTPLTSGCIGHYLRPEAAAFSAGPEYVGSWVYVTSLTSYSYYYQLRVENVSIRPSSIVRAASKSWYYDSTITYINWHR